MSITCVSMFRFLLFHFLFSFQATWLANACHVSHRPRWILGYSMAVDGPGLIFCIFSSQTSQAPLRFMKVLAKQDFLKHASDAPDML